MNILVIGLGYVGSTLAAMLGRQHDVFVLDINHEKALDFQNKIAPINDGSLKAILEKEELSITAKKDLSGGYVNSENTSVAPDYIFISVPTNLNEETGTLDMTKIETVIDSIADVFGTSQQSNVDMIPTIVIKSTLPIGTTRKLKEKHPDFTILFCPEFLREKTAMDDALNPSRIIIGCDDESELAEGGTADKLANILMECTENHDAPLIFTGTEEAEAIKLFSNSYLAMRVAYFNELDSFAKVRGLDSAVIIKGVSMDPRIGDYYNIPGPGFGGHCLPKDTRQLIADFGEQPELLIRATLEANEIRKEFIKEDTEKNSKGEISTADKQVVR